MLTIAVPSSGGSEGTTVKVFLQFGHMKQFRAQLYFHRYQAIPTKHNEQNSPVLLSAYTCTGYFEQAVWAVVSAYFYHDAAVASYCVAFFAEEEVVEGVEAVGG